MALDTSFNTEIAAEVKSLTSADKLEFANLIYSATSDIGDFAEKHNVITDVRKGNAVPIITQGNNYGALSASQGNCAMNQCDFADAYSLKEWVIGPYDCRFEICLDSYSEDFRLFWKIYAQKLDNPLEDPDKDAFFAYVADKAQRNIRGASWRTGYYGDTTSNNTLISKNNGFFTEADAGDGIKVTLPAGELTGQQVYDALADMYLQASNEDWFSETTSKFIVTRKMARTLVTWLNSLSDKSMYNCDCIDPSKVVSARAFGIDNLSIFGIPVISYKEVDEAGKVIGVNPDFKALLINDDNMLVGVNTTEHLNQFKLIYDEVNHKVLVDMKIQIGTAIPLDEYVFATQTAVEG